MEILSDHAGGYAVKKEESYNSGKNATPDIFVTDNSGVCVAIELKMRKLLAKARFGENPVDSAIGEFSEIAKGIYQLWKYLEDSEREVIPQGVRASDQTRLLLVCMEEWLGMSDLVTQAVLDQANEIADSKGLSKGPHIRRYVHYCLLDDLEYILSLGDTSDLVEVLDRAVEEKFIGWSVSSVRDEVFNNVPPKREFGLHCTNRIGDVLEWWNAFEDAAIARRRILSLDKHS